MFKVIRYNRRFGNKMFESYNQARSYVRKYLRSKLGASGTPPLSDYGFSISKA